MSKEVLGDCASSGDEEWSSVEDIACRSPVRDSLGLEKWRSVIYKKSSKEKINNKINYFLALRLNQKQSDTGVPLLEFLIRLSYAQDPKYAYGINLIAAYENSQFLVF